MSELIHAERLLLRPLTFDDAEPTARLMTPGIARWTGSWKGRTSAEEVTERIGRHLEAARQGLDLHRAIERTEDGALLGWIAVRRDEDDPRRASIGYWIGESFFGQGYTKEAARALLAHAWTALDVDVIEGVAQTANIASLAVLRGLGMRHVGQRMEYASARDVSDLCDFYEIERPQITMILDQSKIIRRDRF
jgi:ribosomal-protein-alanine N-acetyltransferase